MARVPGANRRTFAVLPPLAQAKPELPEECEFPNVIEENSFFEQAGHALLRDEAFLLRAAMAKLSADKVLKTIRFFGKVLGTSADYYVLEGAYAEEPEPAEDEEEPPAPDPKAVPAEEAGTGCNKFRYWVCNDLGEEWVELPAVKPAAIVAARAIKKHLTGSLSAPVLVHPPFPGNEADYLRAQIARILHSTYVAPAGMFSFDEDVEEEPRPIVPTEEWEAPEQEEMAEASAWVHHYSTILKVGRVSKPPKEEEEEGEEGEEEEEEPEEDHLLNDLSADPPILESEETPVPAWSVRTVGSGAYQVSYALSNSWPGAIAFCSTKPSVKFANLYIGYGLENTGARCHCRRPLAAFTGGCAPPHSPRLPSPLPPGVRLMRARLSPVSPRVQASRSRRSRCPRSRKSRRTSRRRRTHRWRRRTQCSSSSRSSA